MEGELIFAEPYERGLRILATLQDFQAVALMEYDAGRLTYQEFQDAYRDLQRYLVGNSN